MSFSCDTNPAKTALATFEVENVHDYIGSAIYQDKMPCNQDVRAVRRRWRESPLQVFGTRLKAFLQPRRERSAPHELLFQSRGKAIFFGQSWRQVAFVAAIPLVNDLSFFTPVILAFVLIVSVLVVAFSVSVALGQRRTAGKREKARRQQ